MINTKTFRLYGDPPYRVIVLHGGPGAPGSCETVCRDLAGTGQGVAEHLQNALTIDGLLDEINNLITEYCGVSPVIIFGHSWGAWLGCIYAEKHPEQVSKLILAGSGPFEDKYKPLISEKRRSRLDAEQLEIMDRAFEIMESGAEDREGIIEKYRMLPDMDSYCPFTGAKKDFTCFNRDQYKSLSDEIYPMRTDGKLLRLLAGIKCPVTVIHGREDPHPWEGVVDPVKKYIENTSVYLLDRCGHSPWTEKHAAGGFYDILQREIGSCCK